MKRATIHLLLSGAVLAAGIALGTPEARANEKPALRITEKKVSAVRVDNARRGDAQKGEVRDHDRRDQRRRGDRGEVRHDRKGKRTRDAVELASRKPQVTRRAPVCVAPNCGVASHNHNHGWKRGHGKVYRPYPVPSHRRDYPRWTRYADAVYVDTTPFFWSASLGVYLGGGAIFVQVGNRPPAGYLFYDPIRNRTFTCLDTYRAWCARRYVQPVVTLVAVPGACGYADGGYYGYGDGYYGEGVHGGVTVSFGF
jgi:hypothetical protein